MKRSIAICIAILTCLLYSPSLVFADDPLRDPFYTQGVQKDAPPIDTILEQVDPFSGILTLAHTDIHLPGNGGLDLNLVRTYNSMIWGRRDGTSFPGLVARNERSHLGIGWSMHMGILRNPFGSGSIDRMSPNNPVFEMPDGSKHVFYKDINDTSRFISKDFWIYRPVNSTTGIGTITLTDGTVYTVEYMEFGGSAGYKTLGNPVEQIAQVTKITNAAGTAKIDIGYHKDENGYSYLRTITDSVGRKITFSNDSTAHRLTSITVDNRTFKYSYTTTNSDNYLQSFTPPVGNSWTYAYETAGNTYELNSIAFPTGGTTAYTYDNKYFKTGPTSLDVMFRVVVGKTTGGRGVPVGNWTYSYNSCDSASSNAATTTVIAPGVTEKHTFYGWCNTGNSNVWKVGLPMSKDYSGNMTLSESYSWVLGTKVSNDQIGNANWSGTGGQVYDSAVYVPFLSSKSVARDGKTYTTTYSTFNNYGDPLSISETGDLSRSRTLTYWTNTTKNIVKGEPATESVSGDFPGTSATSWTYDSDSGNVNHINSDGVVKDYYYDTNGNLNWVKWIKGGTNYYTYYWWTNGMISKMQNPVYTEYRSINVKGYIDDETNGRSYKTTYSHDNNLRLTGITPLVGNPTSISYSADSSTKTVTRDGYSIIYTYDGFGRPTGSTDNKGVTTTIAYNAYGVKDYTDSNIGDKTDYDYFGRPIKVTDKDSSSYNNSSERFDYSSSQYPTTTVTVTDKNNKLYTLTYKAFGNPDDIYLASVEDQDQKTTTYSRNIQGNITGIAQGTQGSVTRTFSYNDPVHPDRKTFLMSETNPETGTITYGRDEVGNMTSKTDSSGTKTYIYDAINRLTGITSGASSISLGYDNANNRTSMTSPGTSIGYVYDEVNRLTSKSETIAGRSYSTSYGYDGNDNITRITYPSTRVVNYGVNNRSQITSITGFVTNVSYYTSGGHAGFPSSYTFANNGIVTTPTYNGRQLVTDIAAGSALHVGYGYDSRGNTTSISNYLDSTKNQTLVYDDLSRLTSFSGAWGSGSYGYDTNGLGNRTSKTVAGVQTTSYSYTNNRMSSASGGEPATYNYNGNGTLSGGTWGQGNYTLPYDAFDNIASYKQGTTSLADFTYDGDGMRITKTSNGKTVVYHYDQGGRAISENYSDGRFIADYVYLNGKLVAKVVATPTISVSPTSDSFGNVFLNVPSANHTISVRNTGTANLVIESIGTTGTDYTEFYKVNDGCSGQTLAANASCSFQISFMPTSLGAKSATVTIPSNDPLVPSYNVPINGIGVLPTLTVNKAGTGSGTITSVPAGISCGGNCSASFGTGTQLVLTAIPDSNSSFTGWTGGGCAGTGTCSIALNSDTAVTATFGTLSPVAAFNARATTVNGPFTVNFTDQSQRATSWLWDFGDGTTSTVQNPSHTYSSRGSFTVTLTATNSVGSNAVNKTIVDFIDITSIIDLLLSD